MVGSEFSSTYLFLNQCITSAKLLFTLLFYLCATNRVEEAKEKICEKSVMKLTQDV